MLGYLLTFLILSGQTWVGEGHIISGSGQGGVVKLEITADSNSVRILEGPSQGEAINLSPVLSDKLSEGEIHRTGHSEAGTWEFIQSQINLQVLLHTKSNQFISYLLERKK